MGAKLQAGLGPRLQCLGQGKSGSFPSVTLEVSSSLGTEEGSSYCHGLEKPLGWIGSQGKLVEVGWAPNGQGRSETRKPWRSGSRSCQRTIELYGD